MCTSNERNLVDLDVKQLYIDVKKNLNYAENHMRDYYDYDQYDIEPVDHGDEYVHVDDLPDLAYARLQMQKVLDALYGGESLENLESSLEDVLHILEMKMPVQPLTIRKEVAHG